MAEIPVLEAAKEDTPTSGKKKWLVIGVAGVLALTAAGIAGWALMGTSTPKKGAPVQVEPVKGPPLYAGLDPPFVVNFEAEQAVRFLQITVQVMSRDAATLELLKANDPVVRNDLLMLFANQKYAVISTSEGKERLRAQALEAVRKALLGAGAKADRIEAIYFTSFVMQ